MYPWKLNQLFETPPTLTSAVSRSLSLTELSPRVGLANNKSTTDQLYCDRAMDVFVRSININNDVSAANYLPGLYCDAGPTLCCIDRRYGY